MKRLWFLTTLLFVSFLLTWCINFNFTFNDTSSVVEEDKPNLNSDSWRLFACNEEVWKFFDVKTFWGSWDTEVLQWDSYILTWEITYQVLWEDVNKDVLCTVSADWSVKINEI